MDCHKAAEVLFWMCYKSRVWLLLRWRKGQSSWSHSRRWSAPFGNVRGIPQPRLYLIPCTGSARERGCGSEDNQSLSTSTDDAETAHFSPTPRKWNNSLFYSSVVVLLPTPPTTLVLISYKQEALTIYFQPMFPVPWCWREGARLGSLISAGTVTT